MGILSKLFGSVSDASFIKDAEKLLRVCRSYGPIERGQLNASTKMALAYMTMNRDADVTGSISLFLEVMTSGRRPSDREIGILSAYNLRMMDLQRDAYRSTSRISNAIAVGIPFWLTCNRALMHAALLPFARELWSIIEGGDKLAAYDMLDASIRQLDKHPLAEAIANVRFISTPDIFQPH